MNMARPTKLTPELSKRMCANVTLGMPYEFACKSSSLSYSGFRKWILRGEAELERVNSSPNAKIRKNEEIYVQFVEDIEKSEADAVRNNLALITKAAKDGSWPASAWILERRHPEQFAKHEKIDQKTEHSGGVSINLKMTDCSKKGDE
jgi:hypothetical protein